MQLRDDDGTCKYGNGSAFGRQRSARISEQASSDRRSAGGCAKDGNPAPAAIPDRERKPCSRHGDRRPQPQNVGSLPCHSPGSAEYGQRADHWSERNRERASGARHTRAQQARRETLHSDQLRILPRNDSQLIDRKSTRLNSSHGYISYAVFCLKKKKTTPSPASAVETILR